MEKARAGFEPTKLNQPQAPSNPRTNRKPAAIIQPIRRVFRASAWILWMDEPTAGAGSGGGIGTPAVGAGAAVACIRKRGVCAMIWFATSVPSALQAGQFTRKGMTPFCGSTSKEYRVPQLHWTLIVIPG
jgi:hypothetical protein